MTDWLMYVGILYHIFILILYPSIILSLIQPSIPCEYLLSLFISRLVSAGLVTYYHGLILYIVKYGLLN